MPAIPAWPPQSTPRLFIEDRLSDGAFIRLEGGQAHYLLNVLRVKPGSPVKLCDNQTGEWLAEVADTAKRDLSLRVTALLRPRETVPDLWLLAAPVKKARLDMVVEKACELGVALYQPVITRRTIVERMKMDRLHAQIVEAAEQCGRTALPEIAEAVKLTQLLKTWPAERTLYFADEEGGVPLAEVAKPGPAALLVGPEGGFDADERAAIKALPQAVGVSLGPRILRAETAAIAGLSIWMAVAGDWAA
ncbi:MAG: 16S rRNA (uracil(1498)-N(3))-methyltransferase [Sphingomonadaceae bacterium]|jgi:16S rRNA (uracil1498-N3)-methyltransferase|nr:16S rRNA (uracil(1498)-N(3))-methyltransferase [Sphingomonadaceae bacterium]NCA02054.1 16S rRNA (uracil(1498)-N(3))-methyltransferase [Sphingomonadaceae bacterium]